MDATCGQRVGFKVTIAVSGHLFDKQSLLIYASILNRLIFDAVYGSWILPILLAICSQLIKGVHYEQYYKMCSFTI